MTRPSHALLAVVLALTLFGICSGTATAIPLDGNVARSVGAERYAAAYRADHAASVASAARDDSDGPGWTLAAVAGLVLVVAAGCGGALVGRATARPTGLPA
jgi:hypothetical protein